MGRCSVFCLLAEHDSVRIEIQEGVSAVIGFVTREGFEINRMHGAEDVVLDFRIGFLQLIEQKFNFQTL